MRKTLATLALGSGLLFSMVSHGAIQRCVTPTDGNWAAYCTCFIEQAVNACQSCSEVIHGVCTASWLKKSLHHTSPSLISTQCANQITADKDNNCIAPGTTQEMCEQSINDYLDNCND